MNRLLKPLAIAAMSIAFSVTAAHAAKAAEMPRDIVGNWCYAPRYDVKTGQEITTGKEANTYEPKLIGTDCDSDRPFTITKRSFSWEDGICTALSVQVKEYVNNGRNATWIVKAKCPKVELYTFEYAKGALYVVPRQPLMSTSSLVAGPYEPMRSWTAAAKWADQLHGEPSTNVERRDQ
jgi:hypothetical protein